ncbi:MAG: LD-carboxypeptidase, partial [Flavobacteriaceae bacterium]|nr:LD-carboxypeptidase [Flavobacteriaceae bacterium]
DNAVYLLQDWGLQVRIGKYTFEQDNHFAGTDAQRALDFQEALDDPSIKAIWCARGGYGTVRMIDKVNFTRFEKNPKWIIGFSDVTVLHNEIHNLGRESIHAMMPSTLDLENEEQKKAVKSLKKALFGEKVTYKTRKSDFNKKGEGKGQLVGGNLSILYSLLGSKSSIKTDGKILFIEDVGEYVYHIDRMMQNLRRNGYFKNCEGLIVGGITNIRENDTDFGKAVEQVILDAVADYDFPVAFNFPAGHQKDNRTLIVGREVALKVRGKKAIIEFSESYRSKKKTSQLSRSSQDNTPVKGKSFEGKINLGPGIKG